MPPRVAVVLQGPGVPIPELRPIGALQAVEQPQIVHDAANKQEVMREPLTVREDGSPAAIDIYTSRLSPAKYDLTVEVGDYDSPLRFSKTFRLVLRDR